jgi:GH18 family chitinase
VPVGNGEVYLKEPNNPCEKYWMIDLTHKVRQELDKLGKAKQKQYILSVAVPGRIVDIRATDAYNSETIPEIEKSIDYWNLMTYDMMNRRDGRAVHHAGKQAIEATVTEYTSRSEPIHLLARHDQG